MPPLTVASFATMMQSRPLTVPMPVTIPALGDAFSYIPYRRKRGELEECAPRIDQPRDAFARGQLVARTMTLGCLGTAAGLRFIETLAQLAYQRVHRRGILIEGRLPRVDVGLQQTSFSSSLQARRRGDRYAPKDNARHHFG